MQWPARCPELNLIENTWGVMFCQVCKDGSQFRGINELEMAMADARSNFSLELRKKLVEAMYQRCISALERNGA